MHNFKDMLFIYWVENGQLRWLYRDDFIARRAKEMETGLKDEYLEKVRKSYHRECL